MCAIRDLGKIYWLNNISPESVLNFKLWISFPGSVTPSIQLLPWSGYAPVVAAMKDTARATAAQVLFDIQLFSSNFP
jgi:hypothetical protein